MAAKEDWDDTTDTVHDIDLNELAGLVNHTPFDVSFVQTLGTRAVGYGENVMGMKLQRPVTFTKVTFRGATENSSGDLVVELRKNGSQVTGSSTTITTGNQVAGGSSTGTWAYTTDDILTVYITSAGTNPGDGLIADIKGALT